MFKINDKAKNIRLLNNYMLAKTLSMFKWEGLPESIPAVELEKLLQKYGYAFYTEINGEPLVLHGSLGGKEDAYYRPTKILISNPNIRFSGELDVNNDGVLIKNDSMMLGLIPLLEKYHSLMVENTITLDLNGFNSRKTSLLSASDDKTRESAELFLKRLRKGEPAVIGENAIFDGIKVHNSGGNSTSPIIPLIEYQQYLKANLYAELGINSPFNMKRERLVTDEVNQQVDSLLVFVLNMMEERRNAIQQINTRSKKDIRISFASVWAKLAIQQMEGMENREGNGEGISGDREGTDGEGTETETDPDQQALNLPEDN